jgi:hypothetical protein
MSETATLRTIIGEETVEVLHRNGPIFVHLTFGDPADHPITFYAVSNEGNGGWTYADAFETLWGAKRFGDFVAADPELSAANYDWRRSSRAKSDLYLRELKEIVSLGLAEINKSGTAGRDKSVIVAHKGWPEIVEVLYRKGHIIVHDTSSTIFPDCQVEFVVAHEKLAAPYNHPGFFGFQGARTFADYVARTPALANPDSIANIPGPAKSPSGDFMKDYRAF